MINLHLVCFLERNGLPSNIDCGFHDKTLQVNYIWSLEAAGWEAFLQMQHIFAIFFDLKEAYNTPWPYVIMMTLHGSLLKGRLHLILVSFL